jgi:lipoprotein-releasing system permease protein
VKAYGLLFSIARSLLLARWKQTLVAAIGVTFGITMFVTLLGFMNGLNEMLDGLILNRSPHVKLFNEIKPNSHQPAESAEKFADATLFIESVKPGAVRTELRNSLAILDALRHDDRVLGVSPKITAQVFFNAGSVDITGVINGIDVAAETQLFHFGDYVTSGNYEDLINLPNTIIMGKGAADKIMAKIGDVVQVTTSRGDIIQLKVVGYFQSGLADFDKVQSYASVPTVQKLLAKPASYITDIQVKLKDMSTAPNVAKEYAKRFGCDAEDIQTANAQFETGTKVRTLISYAVGITLLIVAGFGIYNILNMMIYEKMDTIAILKATGFAGSDVKRVFLIIAISIGLVGGFAGLLFGFGMTAMIDQIPFETSALPTIKTYPVSYNPKYYVTALLFSFITTYMAGFFPARKASKVDPVIIIRGK